MALTIKSADEAAYDCISLGEVMLRLDPGEGRIHTARQFAAWEGGGEYNVSRGIRRCSPPLPRTRRGGLGRKPAAVRAG